MITYLIGDATSPASEGTRIIAHICNDVGGWGRGFVVAISEKWREPMLAYKSLFQSNRNKPLLGMTDFISVENKNTKITYVANMIAQHGIAGSSPPGRLVDLEALETCLNKVKAFALSRKDPTIHMPRIGCGLGGAKWEEIEPIVERALGELKVFVYDFTIK